MCEKSVIWKGSSWKFVIFCLKKTNSAWHIKSILVGGKLDVGLLLSVGSVYKDERGQYHISDKREEEGKTHVINVLIFSASTSYSFLMAALICLLLAARFTIKTSVLISSIFFMADSVLRGKRIVLKASIRGAWGIDFLGYLGLRANCNVLGRWKLTEVRTFLILFPLVPLRAAFLAAAALMAAGLAFAFPAAVRIKENLSGPVLFAYWIEPLSIIKVDCPLCCPSSTGPPSVLLDSILPLSQSLPIQTPAPSTKTFIINLLTRSVGRTLVSRRHVWSKGRR